MTARRVSPPPRRWASRRHLVGAALLVPALAAALAAVGLLPQRTDSACCYFSAKDKDILQPAQKVFITWDPTEKVESFTVQPKFPRWKASTPSGPPSQVSPGAASATRLRQADSAAWKK